jgi:hypothetical protein
MLTSDLGIPDNYIRADSGSFSTASLGPAQQFNMPSGSPNSNLHFKGRGAGVTFSLTTDPEEHTGKGLDEIQEEDECETLFTVPVSFKKKVEATPPIQEE